MSPVCTALMLAYSIDATEYEQSIAGVEGEMAAQAAVTSVNGPHNAKSTSKVPPKLSNCVI